MHACLDVELTNSELTNGNLLYEEFVYLVSQKTSAHVVNGLPASILKVNIAHCVFHCFSSHGTVVIAI